MMNLDYTMDITTLLVFLITFLFVYLNTRRPPSVPPGPYLWPVLGNLLSLAGNPLQNLEKLRSSYGDVIGIYIGNSLTVIVSGHDAVKEVLVKQGTLFSWRPETNFVKNYLPPACIGFANGKKWRDNRRFAMTAIQRLCFDKRSKGIENKVNEELWFFVEALKATSDGVDIGNQINLSIANVMCNVLYGNRPGYENRNLLWYLATMDRRLKSFMRDQLLVNCFPFLNWVPLGIFDKNKRINDEIKRYFETYYANIGDTYVEGNETCLVHQLMTAFKAEGYKTWKEALHENSDTWTMLNDLLAAAFETTATAIKSILLFLIREPAVQNKARDEIDKVIGINETPTVNHRKQLPYLEAVIMERLRIGHVGPFTLPHTVDHDITFRGFRIPQNTSILMNLASVLKDPRIYPDPEAFRPERFLSEDGSSVVVPEEFIPFSKGPRSCPGESIARIELFLYMATLIQKFYFHSPDDKTVPGITGIAGLTHYPKPYKIKFVPRLV